MLFFWKNKRKDELEKQESEYDKLRKKNNALIEKAKQEAKDYIEKYQLHKYNIGDYIIRKNYYGEYEICECIYYANICGMYNAKSKTNYINKDWHILSKHKTLKQAKLEKEKIIKQKEEDKKAKKFVPEIIE